MNIILSIVLKDLYTLAEALEQNNNFKASDRCMSTMVQVAQSSKQIRTASYDDDNYYQSPYDDPDFGKGMTLNESMFERHTQEKPYVAPPPKAKTNYQKEYGWTPEQFQNHMKNYPGIKTVHPDTLNEQSFWNGHYWVMPKGELYQLPYQHYDSLDYMKSKLDIDPEDFNHPANNEGYSFFINGSGGSIRVYLETGIYCIAEGIPDVHQIETLRKIIEKGHESFTFFLNWTSEDGKQKEEFKNLPSFEAFVNALRNNQKPKARYISPLSPFLHDERQYKLNR